MSDALNTTIDALAVFRLTKLVTDDEITSDLRGWWYERHDPGETKLGYLVSCPWCVGFWVAAAAVTARTAAPAVWGPAARVLALSTAAGIIQTRI